MDVQIRFQPTLFVYLGTSSGQVAWRVKSLLREAYGEVPVLRHLWVDIDTAVDTRARPLFSEAERAELSEVNGAAVVKNLEHYPHIREWWPEDAPSPGLMNGPGTPHQMRLAGRLAFFRKFNDRSRGPAFIDKLRAALEALYEIENIEATQAMSGGGRTYSVERGCRVVLVYSPCGGTGSSMAFDVAYLCRHLLAGKSPTIISISFLPEAVDKAIRNETQGQKEKIRANAYAWFKEENELSSKPRWLVTYPEGGLVDVDAPPFDVRFIVDIENQAGYRLNAAEDVFQMIAQSIFLDTGSSLAGAMRGFTANVSALGEEFEGMRRAFSSLAAASLVYPRARLIEYCAARLGAVLLEGGLQPPEPHQAETVVSSLVTQLGLRDANLLAALGGPEAAFQALEPAILKADSVAAALTQVDAQEAQNAHSRRAALEALQARAAETHETARAGLDAELARVAATGGLGLALAAVDLLLGSAPAGESSGASLEGLKDRIRQQGYDESDLQEARARVDRARAALKSLDDGLEDALERMVSKRGWQRKLALAKREALSAMANLTEVTIGLAAQAHAAQIYDTLAAWLTEQKTALQSAAADLRRGARDLARAAASAEGKHGSAAGRYEFLQEIPLDFDAIYCQHAAGNGAGGAGAGFPNVVPAQALGNLAALTRWAREGAVEHAMGWGRAFFGARLERAGLLDALREQALREGREPTAVVQEALDRLVSYCHPFWRFDADRGLNETEGKSIIGVEDENSPLLPAAYRGGVLYEIKTTGFRDRIDVARIRHGLPAFLIHGMSEWKAIYEKMRKSERAGRDPLHVLPGMESAADLAPERGRKNRDTFAAAVVFGYIVQVGSWYYYDKNKAYRGHGLQPGKAYRLAQGREKAEEAFTRREDWARAAAESIEDEVRQMGNKAAIDLLEGFINSIKAEMARMKSPDEALRTQMEKETQALARMQQALGKTV